MRELSGAAAEAYLEGVLEQLCDELRSIGIQCEECENLAIDEFGEAIGKVLHGPDWTLGLDEVAQ